MQVSRPFVCKPRKKIASAADAGPTAPESVSLELGPPALEKRRPHGCEETDMRTLLRFQYI